MVRRLHWKVKGVSKSFLLAGLLIVVSTLGYSQSTGDIKVNCSFSSTPLETAISFLSHQSGINFVYSSNKVDVTKTVSLVARDKSLADVLGLIGKQVGMVFRIEGRHVTIKENEPVRSITTPVVKPTMARATALSTPKQPLIKYYAPQVPPTSTLFSTHSSLKKEFERLQPYFDSTFLKIVPAHYIRRINSRTTHSGLFISAGATLNNYSTGLELQAGLRQIYAVFSPGWLRNGDYLAAYGLGSSFNLSHNFSFNPVYLYGTVSGSDSYYRINKYSYPSQVLIQHSVQHHQLKLMLQYAVTSNIVVKLGPTLNQTSTTYKYHETPLTIVQVVRGDPYSHDGSFHTVNYVTSNGSAGTSKPPIYQDYRTRDFWIGWEASLSFKLNFFPRKIVAASH